jgi:hypothetical protein
MILGYATERQRPAVDSFRGRFWQGGKSFPSDHAAGAFAIASVLSHEYPGPFTKILAYGAASAITFARVRGQNHFPSDALVGSGIGWLAGWQVYRQHHDRELGGSATENLTDTPASPADRATTQMGSPYVPLDSWIYPLFDRLIASGAINDAILGMRPWTRLECARLVSEAGDRLQDADPSAISVRLYNSLHSELASELALLGGGANNAVHLESLYARATQISGPPLTDGYHFGQTLYNDSAVLSSRASIAWSAFPAGPLPVAGSSTCAENSSTLPPAWKIRRNCKAFWTTSTTTLAFPPVRSPPAIKLACSIPTSASTSPTGNSPMARKASGGVPGAAVLCSFPTMPLRCACSTSIASLLFVFPPSSTSSVPCAGTPSSATCKASAFPCTVLSRRKNQLQTYA